MERVAWRLLRHRPGETLFVDWAGDKISVHEADNRGVLQASLFVAVLRASSYTYAEATEDETTPNWIGAHVRAFEFMGGVAELLIPDNTKTGVSKVCRYEPDLNCLASLCHDTRDRAVLAALAQSALEDPDEYVRDSAYQSLLLVNGLPEDQRQRIFQSPPHVDPARVKAILSGIAG